ncbi:MAG TPA: hypothetical protein VFJ78_06130 [Gaiellaceae bacterium]|nr:hypothetical protein [Gaiellaceae bacterium]
MSRIEAARRNIKIARGAIGVAALSLLAIFGAAARASHPGTQSRSQSQTSSSAVTASEDDSSTFFGLDDGSSIGPSGSAAPSIQTGGS